MLQGTRKHYLCFGAAAAAACVRPTLL